MLKNAPIRRVLYRILLRAYHVLTQLSLGLVMYALRDLNPPPASQMERGLVEYQTPPFFAVHVHSTILKSMQELTN